MAGPWKMPGARALTKHRVGVEMAAWRAMDKSNYRIFLDAKHTFQYL
jgi:hypothetical protein